MIQVRIKNRPLRVLDFDIENRPLTYIAPDYPGAEVTVIAWSWEGEAKIHCKALGEDDGYAMLGMFRMAYDQADMVTGHYIRGHDLPLINGALVEKGMPPLEDKLTCDTKLDLIKMSGISKSQKNLAALLKAQNEKMEMSDPMWRCANRLEPVGITWAKERCIGDVRQHKEMKEEMLRLGLLRPPRMWTSAGPTRARYVP